MEEENLKFSEVPNIDSYTSLFGLNFNDSASEFQKACLTMAYMVASFRDNILKGNKIPAELIEVADRLWLIVMDNEYTQ